MGILAIEHCMSVAWSWKSSCWVGAGLPVFSYHYSKKDFTRVILEKDFGA